MRIPFVLYKFFPFVLLMLGVSVLLNVFLFFNRVVPSQTPKITVQSVIDGDTFILSTGEHVKLLGVNAPELGRCYADEAKGYLESRILSQTVSITEEKKDNFGRRMGLVYVGETLINTDVIRLGYAKPDYTKNSHSVDFIAAYDEAKKNSLGVNSDTCKKTATTTPPDLNCVIKGNIDKASGKKFYHLPECPHYNQIVLDLDTGEQYFCSEKEALAKGFIKTSECE